MRKYDYDKLDSLLTPEIVNLIASIHEHKGRQESCIEAKPAILGAMLEAAKVRSTGSSNRIEGVFSSDARLRQIVKENAQPLNRPEQEIAGYSKVLNTINENYAYINPKPNVILQLHRDLYSYSAAPGGRWKNSDNLIEEIDGEGERRVRFSPVCAFETPAAMEALCGEFTRATGEGKYDQLLLIPVFILDFLCIHPFNDGNGRMSRLLTLLLLYRAGYTAGQYVSLESIIEDTKEAYYDSLQRSSAGWHEGINSYSAFVKYYLGVILHSYAEFDGRVEHLGKKKPSKAQRVRDLFAGRIERLSKAEIAALCPDVSISTIETSLAALLAEGYIVKTGKGRSTAYIRNQ